MMTFDKINRDWTRPKMKFVPMPAIKSSHEATAKFIQKQRQFEKKAISFSLRNLRPPDTIIHFKN